MTTATGLRQVTAIAAGSYFSLMLGASVRPAWDANADGIVDLADVALVGAHWLETW